MSRSTIMRWSVSASFIVATLAVGGSLFEHLVIDRAWPANVEIIQPAKGGVDRKVFWIPVHVTMTILLLVALWSSWRQPAVRRWVLIAIAGYAAMRIWSAVYFIPVALQFEAAEEVSGPLAQEARKWVFWSPIRSLLLVGSMAALRLADREAGKSGKFA